MVAEEMAGKSTLLKTLIFFYVFLRRGLDGLLSPNCTSSNNRSFQWSSSPKVEKLGGRCRPAVVCDFEGGLLRSSSLFPYFMLVALESGGLLRAILLLLLYPFLWCVGEEVGLKVMAMVCFCGIKKEGFTLGRTVLPKHLLEDVGMEGFQLLSTSGGKKVCVTSMPRVMVESTLKEYLGMEVVVGREMKVAGGYYTGLIEDSKEAGELLGSLFSGEGGGDGVLWFGGCKKSHHKHPFFSKCKEVYIVNEAEKKGWHPLPRDRYRKPLLFHDGRIVFRPTPAATLAMLLWLPFGCLVIILRIMALLCVFYKLPRTILPLTGMKIRIVGSPVLGGIDYHGLPGRGRLYACNHRSLFDPVYVSGLLGKPVTAVIYGVSQLTEVLSPIKVVRLERDREEDRKKMEAALMGGDLVVCPEGTTCREPYVLRFSPLFAEVAAEGVVPVALDIRESMFRGTTATGRKWMDGFFFGMNPTVSCTTKFLEAVPVVKGDGTRRSRYVVANEVQGEIAKALGYECSMLARRDKYQMLAGTDGRVNNKRR